MEHAVVIGASVAGLLTARVLADHIGRVTLVERDRLPDEAGPRPGVPQGRHVHVLLSGGQRALDDLLAGVLDELRSQGVPEVGLPPDVVMTQGGRWIRREPATETILTGTRPRLEHIIRRRVLADPRIGTMQGMEAVGLLGDARRVRGVRVRPRGTGSAGAPGPATGVTGWYLGPVQAHAAADPVVGRAFRAVLSLSAPPGALFAPRIARAVLFSPLPHESAPQPPLVPEPAVH